MLNTLLLSSCWHWFSLYIKAIMPQPPFCVTPRPHINNFVLCYTYTLTFCITPGPHTSHLVLYYRLTVAILWLAHMVLSQNSKCVHWSKKVSNSWNNSQPISSSFECILHPSAKSDFANLVASRHSDLQLSTPLPLSMLMWLKHTGVQHIWTGWRRLSAKILMKTDWLITPLWEW